jgi:alpha-L-fucosidase
VTILGHSGSLQWTQRDDGKLVIDVPAAARAAGKWAWTFKIS